MYCKLFAFCGLLVITASFAYAAYQGYRYRTTGDKLRLERHRGATSLALWYTMLGIALIETGARMRPPGPPPALLWVHLPLAVAFFALLLVLRFWLTGLASRHHGRLGRVCAGFFAGTLVTGVGLIWQM